MEGIKHACTFPDFMLPLVARVYKPGQRQVSIIRTGICFAVFILHPYFLVFIDLTYSLLLNNSEINYLVYVNTNISTMCTHSIFLLQKCHACKLKIAAGDQRVGWKDLSWHVLPDCFCCVQCSKSLLGGMFVVKNEQPFCNKDCFQAATQM